jgi:hypothetical protein
LSVSVTRAVAVAAVLTGLALVVSTPAPAQTNPDASCPGPREDNFVWLSPSGGGNNRVAQTFTAQASGLLTTAQSDVTKTGSLADWTMDIHEVDGSGTPTNVVLASTTIPDSTVPAGDVTITGNFGAPVTVIAGQQYALIVRRPGSDHLQVGVRTGDDCPGQLFSSPATGTFSPFMDWDMVFAVFVEPAQPQPEPVAKADRTLTLDANKGKVEKGRKVRLTGQIDAPLNEAGCEPNQTVELQRKAKKAPDTAFATFKTVQTDQTGNFADKVKVKKTRIYRAVVQESGVCDDELSNTQKVRVQKKKAAQEA